MSDLVRDWKAEKRDLEEAFDIISDKLVKADAEIARLKRRIELEIGTIEMWQKSGSSNAGLDGIAQRLREAVK